MIAEAYAQFLAQQAAYQEMLLDFTVRRHAVVMFHQDVDPASVDRLESVLVRGDHLDLQSNGGDLDAATRMAALIRDRGVRVQITGECGGECAMIWAAARQRLIQGFSAVTFDGDPIALRDWMRDNPDSITLHDLEAAEHDARAAEAILESGGVSPWLLYCASRLLNRRYTLVATSPLLGGQRRWRPTGDYDAVWFPLAVIEAAGVNDDLSRFDPPNARQRQDVETLFGTVARPRRILWAGDDACDLERRASESL